VAGVVARSSSSSSSSSKGGKGGKGGGGVKFVEGHAVAIGEQNSGKVQEVVYGRGYVKNSNGGEYGLPGFVVLTNITAVDDHGRTHDTNSDTQTRPH
jgi:hypothetical protein